MKNFAVLILFVLFLMGCNQQPIVVNPPPQKPQRNIIVVPPQPRPNINIEVNPKPHKDIHIDIRK